MEIPKYAMCGPPYNKSAKTMQPIHSFTKLKFDLDDVESNYNGIMGPLKTLDQIRDDDPELSLTSLQEEDKTQDAVPLERPVTPIDDEIKAAPTSVTELGRLVRRRIVPKPENEQLTEERQKELASIIMGEVNWAWAGLKTVADDPFLTAEENRELHRRVTVHFVTVCQDLFLQYIEKFSGLNLYQIFSEAATMTRLKAQLTTEVRAHLDVHRIRRNILEDFKRQRVKILVKDEREEDEQTESDNWLQQAMPTLDSSHLDTLLADVPKHRLLMALSARAEKEKLASVAESEDDESSHQMEKPVQRRKPSHIVTRDNLLLKKAISSMDLTSHVTLLQQLGLSKQTDRSHASESRVSEHIARKQQDVKDDTKIGISSHELPHKERPTAVSSVERSTDFINNDLLNLMRESCDDNAEQLTGIDDTMPALLQAIIRSSRHDGQLARFQAKLTELQLREKRRKEKESVWIQAPHHIQPKTTSSKMNKMEVRTSDSRVSERVCLSNVTLRKHPTVYNDLLDEIGADSIKKLDSNLFLGDEITEVYSEIMNTVSKQHLQLEDDPMVVHSPAQIDRMDTFGLPTTGKRVTNPLLKKPDTAAPWGNMDRETWIHTPINPPKDQKGRPMIMPMTPRGEGTTPTDLIPVGESRPPTTAEAMGEVMGRAYKTWSNWWKTTNNADDYMKYLSTQDTDYMDAVFHLYDSSDEDEVPDARSAARLAAESSLSKSKLHIHDTQKTQRKTAPGQKGKQVPSPKQLALEEMQRKMAELQEKKNEFHAGFWNTNTVLMGGLGKEPECEDSGPDPADLEPVVEERPEAKVVDLKVRLVSKKAQRMEQSFKEEEAAKKGRQRAKSGDRPVARSASRHTTTESVERSFRQDEPAEDEEVTVSVQDRLETLWTLLQMPDKQRLDMAIKYSSDEYRHHLDEALAEWESVCWLIQQREALVNQLEHFEKTASDPNRFFEIGYRGSAVARLNEARVRSTFYRKLEPLDKKIKCTLDLLMKQYKDTVTYQGRCYLEKMKWDRTEMLYWLQEERKQQAIILENTIIRTSTTALPTSGGGQIVK